MRWLQPTVCGNIRLGCISRTKKGKPGAYAERVSGGSPNPAGGLGGGGAVEPGRF